MGPQEGTFSPLMRKRKATGTGLPKYVRRHGPGYRAVITVRGKRRRGPVFPTPDEAHAWAVDIRDNADLPDRGVLTLEGAMDLLRRDLADSGARAATVAFYESHAKTVLPRFGGGDRRISDIGPDDVRAYLAQRREKGVRASTVVTKELLLLRRLMRLARAEGYTMPQDAFRGVRLPKVQKRRFGYLTQPQVAAAVAEMRKDEKPSKVAGVFWADVVELLFQTGIRRAELVRLRVRDIDFERGRFFVAGKARDRHQTFGKALEPVLRRLIRMAGDDGRIVPDQGAVVYAFTHWRRKLRLAEFSPHVLRHSYGTAMAERVSQWQLMGLMDHADLKQTARYYHARGEDVRDALDGLRLD